MLKVKSIVNSIFDSLTWLLSEAESNQVCLIDCGDVEPIIKWLDNRTIASVLLTHAHFDHIYGLPQLLLRFPECKIYTNESGKDALANAKLNMSFYHESPVTVSPQHVNLLGDGDEIALFNGISAKVYATPGHHPSCLTFLIGDYLFTGDAYIPGVKVVTNLPKGNKTQAEESLKRIMALGEVKKICCGHDSKQI